MRPGVALVADAAHPVALVGAELDGLLVRNLIHELLLGNAVVGGHVAMAMLIACQAQCAGYGAEATHIAIRCPR